MACSNRSGLRRRGRGVALGWTQPACQAGCPTNLEFRPAWPCALWQRHQGLSCSQRVGPLLQGAETVPSVPSE